MRHVLLPGAPAPRPYRVGQPTATARLVALTSRPPGVISRHLCTTAGAIDLAAVAAGADQHLSTATRTHEQPGRRFRRRPARTWTASAMLGIMPRHACSARCGARRRSGTWRFRSAPCLPIRQVVTAPVCVRCTPSCRQGVRTPVDMWTTQERCPHTHSGQNQQQAFNLIDSESLAQTSSSYPGNLRPRFSSIFRHLCADLDSHSQMPGRRKKCRREGCLR
jgi:hypothetical protein